MGQCGRDYFIDDETEAQWRLNNLAKTNPGSSDLNQAPESTH